jgi:hypothetical protein
VLISECGLKRLESFVFAGSPPKASLSPSIKAPEHGTKRVLVVQVVVRDSPESVHVAVSGGDRTEVLVKCCSITSTHQRPKSVGDFFGQDRKDRSM